MRRRHRLFQTREPSAEEAGAPRVTPRARSTQGGEAALLAISALVVLLGTAVVRRDASARGPELDAPRAGTTRPLPPPLPNGAPHQQLADLPVDDEHDSGCHFSDRGFGDYGDWRKLPVGKVLVPVGRAVAADGSFPLLVHFHGAEPVRKELAPQKLNLVIAAVDAGSGSHAYELAMGQQAFDRLVVAVEREVATANGLPAAHARPIAISSWSAGYGAVGQVLARPHPRIEALVLLDSLYAGYLPGHRSLEHGQIAPFVDAARAALHGNLILALSHTEIATPGYASTGEVASFLLSELGAHASEVSTPAAGEANPMTRLYEEGHLSIRGFAGVDRDAHCSQLRLLGGTLRETILPAWRRQ